MYPTKIGESKGTEIYRAPPFPFRLTVTVWQAKTGRACGVYAFDHRSNALTFLAEFTHEGTAKDFADRWINERLPPLPWGLDNRQ